MSSPPRSYRRSLCLALLAAGALAIPVITAVRSHASKGPAAASTPRSGLLLFHTAGSGMEQEFLGTLALDQVRVIPVARLDSDAARRFGIRTTPTLLRLADGKEAVRCEGAREVAAALQLPAASPAPQVCRLHPVARLR